MLRDTQPMGNGERAPRFSVLLVDDNDVNRLALSRWLEKHGGYRVVTAEDGRKALHQMENESFDLVILDIMMPVMSGTDVLKRLRETYSSEELPIIMATAKTQSEDMVEAFNLGANDYITKPIDFPVALARVQAQLRTAPPSRDKPRPFPAITSLREVKPGMTLEGKYRLDELIGSGSNGAVYRATHLTLNRQVAIKVLHTGLGDNDVALHHFLREGVSACRVEHPNAVTVLDLSACNGVVYLVMELLRGCSLYDEIQRHGPMSVERTAQILLPICDVLTEAHTVGIIHRDIKPQNTFLHRSRRGEVVKVLDFGLAKLFEGSTEHDGEETPTFDGIAGTLAYIAPERCTADRYDGRADVYSLGCMLYEMLTGHLPFTVEGNNPLRMMMLHVREKPPTLSQHIPDVDPEVEKVVLQTLEKDPRKRPTAEAVKESFARILGVSIERADLILSEQSGFMLRVDLEESLENDIGKDWKEKYLSPKDP